MARPIPKLLFRAWSADSNGLNSQNLFKSGSRPDKDIIDTSTGTEPTHGLGEKLRAALLWKKMDENPFIFFSNSMLFSLQLAARMKAQGESNIYITCLNTETARTDDGSPAQTYSVNELLKKYDIEIRNRRDGSLRSYSSEFVAMRTICPRAGSRCVAYDSLIGNGLFDLYPQLHEVNQRHNVRLHLACTDLRKFGFSSERALGSAEIDVAARLALSFKKIVKYDNDESEGIESHLLAWLLSFRKRKQDDDALFNWVKSHTSIELEPPTTSTVATATNLDEVEAVQYKQLVQLVSGRSLLRSKVDSSSTIDQGSIARERAAWQLWRRGSRDMHRAEREARTGNDSHHRRRRNDRTGFQRRTSRFTNESNAWRDRSRSPRRDAPRRYRDYRFRA